jgi:O-acetylhomoserine/O-acetylserine sulfhydrylase-like pyridoxal-dependent enzyme
MRCYCVRPNVAAPPAWAVCGDRRAHISRVQAAGLNSAIDFGVPERVVRLHIGLEGANALWGDLDAAIAAAA